MSTAARGGGRGRGGRGRGGYSGAPPARDYGGHVAGGSGNRGRGHSRGGARGASKAKNGDAGAEKSQPDSHHDTMIDGGPEYGEPQPGETFPDGDRLISYDEFLAIEAGRPFPPTTAKPSKTRAPSAPSTGTIEQRYRTLKSNREHERKDAIKNGFLADPDKPRKLKDAITPVGTCQDMCPEFERVSRIYERDVWSPEHDPKTIKAGSKRVPMESRMVKKFRRAAAGVDEQLPSDLRPPLVLKKTVDYLLNSLLSEGRSLADVHHFIWDRARAVRNDFSIQQLRKVPDVRVAIECYERIARFHIVSMHKLAMPQKPYESYEWFQEREQLDKTLLSLIQYYDDNRARYRSPNEAEFRAYCIIFQIHAHVPDMEHRIQELPEDIMWNPRVQAALKLYAAAGNVRNYQGPMRPESTFKVAQQNWMAFWELVKSPQVSYLMGCVAEVYFNQIRENAMQCIFRTYKQGGATKCRDWTVRDLLPALGFDHEDDVKSYVKAHRFQILTRDDGHEYWDINGIVGKVLPSPSGLRSQYFSQSLVERKRCGRTLPAVINGMSVKSARAAGMVDPPGAQVEAKVEAPKGQSLFVTSDSDSEPEKVKAKSMAPPAQPSKPSVFGSAQPSNASAFGSPFGGIPASAAAGSPFGGVTASTAAASPKNAFGAPSAPSALGFGKPLIPTPDHAAGTASPKPGLFGPPASSTTPVPTAPATSAPPATSLFSGFGKAPSSAFGTPATTASPFSGLGKATAAPATVTPSLAFSGFQSSAPSDSLATTATAPASAPSNPATNFSAFGKPPASAVPASNFLTSTTPASSPFGFPPTADPAQAPKSAATVENTSPKATQASPNNAFGAPTGSKPFGFFPQTQNTTPTHGSTAESTFTPAGKGKASALSFGSDPTSTTPAGEPEKVNAFGFSSSQLAGNKPIKHVTFASPTASSAPTTFCTSTTANSASSLGRSTTQPTISFTPQSTPPSSFSFDSGAKTASTPSLGAFNPNKAVEAPKAAQTSIAPSPSGLFNQAAPQQPVATQTSTQNQAPTFTPPVQTASPTFTPPTQNPPASSTNAVVPSPAEQSSAWRKRQASQVLDMAAEQIFTAPYNGVLAQYIEFTSGDLIKELIDQVEAEKAAALADEFRQRSLAKRFGKAWYKIYWTNHLRRRGKASRARRRAQIEDLAKAKAQEKSANETTVDVFRRTATGASTRSKPLSSSANGFRHSNKENVRNVVHDSAPGDHFLDPVPLAQLAKGKPKDSGRQSKAKSGADKHTNGHTDGKDRVSKASAKTKPKSPKKSKPAEPETRKRRVARKSWMEENVTELFRENHNNARISTTKTDYFRLRALGIDANELRTTRKRGRMPDDEGEAPGPERSGDSSTPPERKRLLMARRRDRVRSTITPMEHERPSSAPHATKTSATRTSGHKTREQIDAEDDALIARFRAITKQITDDTEWFRSTREKREEAFRSSSPSGFRSSEELRRSFGTTNGPSASSYNNRPTYDPLASSYNKFRRSTFGDQEVSADLPKYWYRESRFLPRSEYGGARWLAKKEEEKAEREARKSKENGTKTAAENVAVSQTQSQPQARTAPSAAPAQQAATQSQTVGRPTQNSTTQPASSSARTTNGTSAPRTRQEQGFFDGHAVDAIEILSSDDDEAPAPAVRSTNNTAAAPAAPTPAATTNGITIKTEPQDDDDAPGPFIAQDASYSHEDSEISDADEEYGQEDAAAQQYDDAFFAQNVYGQGMQQYDQSYDAYAPAQDQYGQEQEMYYPDPSDDGGPRGQWNEGYSMDMQQQQQQQQQQQFMGQHGGYVEEEVQEEDDEEMSDVIDEDDDDELVEDDEFSDEDGQAPGPSPDPGAGSSPRQAQPSGPELQSIGNSVEDAIEL